MCLTIAFAILPPLAHGYDNRAEDDVLIESQAASDFPATSDNRNVRRATIDTGGNAHLRIAPARCRSRLLLTLSKQSNCDVTAAVARK
jgi:hypothetical protein